MGGEAAPTAPPASQPPKLRFCPAQHTYLLHLSEDSQQISSKDTLELFLIPATPQQLLYQYWVSGHVFQSLRETVWPPGSQLVGPISVPWS